MVDLNLNVNGDARRARAALNDVATGSERAARITDQLSRSFDHLEHEANGAQRALDRVNDEIRDTGPTEELNAELSRLQHRLEEISNERRVTESMRAEFRRASASAATLDHELAGVRRELDRLNDEYSRGGDPAVLRRIQDQQRELNRLNGIRRRISDEDEANQHRLGLLADEARRAQGRRDDEERRRSEDEDNRSWIRRLRRRASNLGDNAGNGLQGAPVPPTALAVGGVIGAAAAVPLLAAIGGALTGLAGFGVAGAGIAGAVLGDPQKFQDAWGSTTEKLKKDFFDATAVFAGPTLDAIESIGPLVDSWHLDETFASAAKYVKPLVGGVEGFATGVIRGVSAMVDKGEPAVKALSAGLIELGDAAGDAFTDIADGADGGAEALRDVIFGVAGAIRVFGMLTEAAEDTYGYIHDHPIASAFMSGGLSLPLSWLDSFSDSTEQFATDLDGVAQSADGVAQAGHQVDETWQGAAAAMEEYEGILHNIVDVQLGLLDANIGWEQSLDDLTDSIKENGHNWDITTQKGRDNTAAVEDAYKAAIDFRDAQVESGVQVGVANEQLTAQIAYLEGIARKAGMTKEQFDAMTAGLKNYLALPMNKTVVTKFLDIHYVSVEGRVGDGTDPRTRVGSAYAEGGDVTDTGPMLVGEKGPEIVWGSRDQFVSTAAQTRQLTSMMGRGGSPGGSTGGALTMRITGDTTGYLGQALAAGLNSGQIQIFDGNGQPVTAR